MPGPEQKPERKVEVLPQALEVQQGIAHTVRCYSGSAASGNNRPSVAVWALNNTARKNDFTWDKIGGICPGNQCLVLSPATQSILSDPFLHETLKFLQSCGQFSVVPLHQMQQTNGHEIELAYSMELVSEHLVLIPKALDFFIWFYVWSNVSLVLSHTGIISPLTPDSDSS